MTPIIKSRICKGAALVAVLSTLSLGLAAAPAKAVYSPYVWGSTGAWLSSPYASVVSCNSTFRYIRTAGDGYGRGPYVGRTPVYPAAVQLIEMWPRLDYWDWGSNSWRPWTYGPRQTAYVSPGYMAVFSTYSFVNVPAGHWRVGYVFRWSVNGSVVGVSHTVHTDGEYSASGSSGAYCTF